MPKINLDNVEINYYLDEFVDPWIDRKSVPFVLMHHGFARNSKFWTGWVPTLARKCKVLRYDARGCGESSFPENDCALSLETLCKDALALIDKLEIEHVHWVGTLSGGMVGQMFAILYPNRIKSLTLCYSPCNVFGANPILRASQNNASTAMERLGIREWRAQTVAASLDISKADSNLVDWTINEMAKTPKHVAVSLGRAYESIDLSGRLSEIKAPTLIMVGDKSKIVSQKMRDFMQEQIPNSRLCVFPNIADGIDLLIPEQCAKVTLNFITELT